MGRYEALCSYCGASVEIPVPVLYQSIEQHPKLAFRAAFLFSIVLIGSGIALTFGLFAVHTCLVNFDRRYLGVDPEVAVAILLFAMVGGYSAFTALRSLIHLLRKNI